jgi:acyl carrier protein
VGAALVSVKLTIIEQIKKVAEEQDKRLRPLSDSLVLLESGLDSLCLAILVVRLEDALGVDPFTTSDNNFPVTLGDFVRAYENVVR